MDCCCICGTVKNCGPYLDRVFDNIKQITKLFRKYVIIIYCDVSTDDTVEKIIKFKKELNIHFHLNKQYNSPFRTHRLAYGRNYCLNVIRSHYLDYKYFIMMDFDDVNCNKINISPLKKCLLRSDWDAVSFNKTHYYDIWALSVRPYIFSFIHFENSAEVAHKMTEYVKYQLNNLEKDKLLECVSSFNGFMIYNSRSFLNCAYDGNIRLDLIPSKYINTNILINESKIVYNDYKWLSIKDEDCEHRSFHILAKTNNNAKLFISPEILF